MEFCGMEDWGLQAVVRGSSGDYTNIINTDIDVNEKSTFGFLGSDQMMQYDHHEFGFDFPEFFDAIDGSSAELEELYKPFYQVENSVSAQTVAEFKEEITPQNVEIQEQIKIQNDPSDQTGDSTTSPTAYTPKYKRRKNQHKRRVVQVSADDLSSDAWAWRKYGQKPIKGSPYPRSYYRCSSSKGCLARKQVEQSCTDPGMFIITYTAEHSHSKPTRRNSLAGTIRQKFPASKSPNGGNVIKQEKIEDSTSSGSRISAPLIMSPENLLPLALEEDFLLAKSNQEGKEEDDLLFGDDFFSGLEEFDGFNSDILPMSCHTSAQQFPLRSCS